MSVTTSRAQHEAEFMQSAGSAVNTISEILNKDILREDEGEEAALNNRLRGGLLDALELIGFEMLARSEDLFNLVREREKGNRS